MIFRKFIFLIFCFAIYVNQGICQPAAQYLNDDEGFDYGLQLQPEGYRKLQQSDTIPIRNQINYSLTIVRREPDSTRYLLRDALSKSLYLNYDCGIATALADIGYVNTIEGNYQKAILYYRKALPYAIKGLRNRTSLAMFYTCMSAPYFRLAMYDSMYYYSSKAEQIVSGIKCKSEGEVVDVSSIYNNLGILWSGVNNFKKSALYLQKAKNVVTSFSKKSTALRLTEANLNSNIGLIYFENEQLDSAKYLLNLSLKYYPDNPLTLITLGKIAVKESRPDEAVTLLQQAIIFTVKAHDYTNNLYAKSVLGILYYDQKKYNEAEVLLNEVVKESGNQGDNDLSYTYQAYQTLSAIKALNGNYQLAYDLEKRSLELLDSMKVKEKMISVYDLESQLEIANRDKAIATNKLLLAQTNNKLKERTFWIIVIAFGAIIFIVLLASFYRNSKNKQRLQLKELNDIQKDREINYLRAMIKGEEQERARLAREIHDGIMVQFSTIKMGMKVIPDSYRKISSEVFFETDYYRELIDSMETATTELRSTAHNLMPDMLLQGGLAEAVFYFCNTIKKNTQLCIDFQLHGTIDRLDAEFELSVYRIIQELMQNIIKHAHASKVILQMASVGNVLSITIEDDGKGFNVEAGSNGMGLMSIKNRLRVMNGIMDIQSNEKSGTSIHIEFEILSSQQP
ncbi:hypothetical protein F0919_00225 [Taibaiella lutea]|uniref:Histidine kinase domain-containing protein n=1 Tax=Taibaiella lutea TaxID=2608001 RepID=A0A5M6CQ84_9BACT|nr:ATP-binding protein [Taibaiella lutea]KAA5536132.1 hypothetical protein F0919_00225 [Taibaiella lutea]